MSIISPNKVLNSLQFRKLKDNQPYKNVDRVVVVEGYVVVKFTDGRIWIQHKLFERFAVVLPDLDWPRYMRLVKCLKALGIITEKDVREHQSRVKDYEAEQRLRSDQEMYDSIAKKYGLPKVALETNSKQ